MLMTRSIKTHGQINCTKPDSKRWLTVECPLQLWLLNVPTNFTPDALFTRHRINFKFDPIKI